MTAVAITGMGPRYMPGVQSFLGSQLLPTLLDSTIDAVDESVHFIGKLWLPARTGSKTFNTSSKVHWMVGAATITFDAGKTLRVGIQTVDTANGPAARGDGTFDVYGDLVGGTDTLTAATFTSTQMGTGSVSLTHGDLIAVCFTMTAYAGSGGVKVRGISALAGMPSTTLVTAGPVYTTVSQMPLVCLEMSDGTFGWIDGSMITSTGALFATLAFDLNTTPDEYAQIFQVEAPVNVDGFVFTALFATGGDCEVILYSDPEGTPVAVETFSLDQNTVSTAAARPFYIPFGTVRSLAANTKYAVGFRPTTTADVNMYYFDVAAAGHLGCLDLGTNCYIGSRTGNSGAFTPTTTRRLWSVGVRISGMDDGVSTGGGIRLAGHGGLAA